MLKKSLTMIAIQIITCSVSAPGAQTAIVNTACDTMKIPGLSQPVEIVKDRWGISHIYAQNQPDLFFAQGFNAARDRLFQLEMWRRRALGLFAEIQGIDLSLISDKVVEIYRASRFPPDFEPADIVLTEYRAAKDTRIGYAELQSKPMFDLIEYVESIGGGEPALPGLSIGHNEHGAWGLTIFSIDQEDLMVYETHPDNPNQYRFKMMSLPSRHGRWCHCCAICIQKTRPSNKRWIYF